MVKRKKRMPNLSKNLLRNSCLKNYEKYAFLIKGNFINSIIFLKIKCKYNENGC